MLSRRVLQVLINTTTKKNFSTQVLPLENQYELMNREHVFSYSRSRDHFANLNLVENDYSKREEETKMEINDTHCEIESYDCRGTVNLSASMQSNVPYPFQSTGKAPVDLNMPGGSILKLDKHLSSHRVSLIQENCIGGNSYVQK